MAKRARSAKSGKYVSKSYAKKNKATTVEERGEKVLGRGYVSLIDGEIPEMCGLRTLHLYSQKIRPWLTNQTFKKVKIVEDK